MATYHGKRQRVGTSGNRGDYYIFLLKQKEPCRMKTYEKDAIFFFSCCRFNSAVAA